jgi:hypothetical protein
MRTLGFRTHVLLAVAAATGLIASLSRPWYASAPPPVEEGEKAIGTLHGPANGFLATLERVVSQTEGISGWDALGTWATVLAALAGLTVLGAAGCLVPALRGIAREVLRYGALALVAVVAWKLVDTPGANAALELRFGALVGAAAALIAFSSGSAVASVPLRRRAAAPAAYTPPPPPPRYETAASAPPPGA